VSALWDLPVGRGRRVGTNFTQPNTSPWKAGHTRPDQVRNGHDALANKDPSSNGTKS
jgi:hypothetical protein